MKKRIIIFSVLTAVSVVFTAIFSLSVCGLSAVKTDFADNVDEMIVDGTDFTPVIETGAFFLDLFMNEVLPVLMYIVFFVVTTLLDLALFGFYRLFGLREPDADEAELRLTRRILVISAISAAAAAAVIALCGVLFGGSSAFCFLDLLLCWQYPLFAWVFCLGKLKKSLRKKERL